MQFASDYRLDLEKDEFAEAVRLLNWQYPSDVGGRLLFTFERGWVTLRRMALVQIAGLGEIFSINMDILSTEQDNIPDSGCGGILEPGSAEVELILEYDASTRCLKSWSRRS